jgi:hypothetical protein
MAINAVHPLVVVCRWVQASAEGVMTDIPGNRLWPLALMGWLAAFPPLARDASAQPAAEPLEAASESGDPALRAGARTAWLRAARDRYAGLSAEERDRLRRRRRPAVEIP